MNKSTKYYQNIRFFGITIGPITRVLSYAQATRGIWAASYFFSWLAKDIALMLSGHEFLKPTIYNEDFTTEDMVGRFPDQYIIEAKPGETVEQVREVIDSVIKNKAQQIAKVLGKDCDKVTTYLFNVLRVTAFDATLSGTKSEIVDQMQSYMGVLDNRDAFQVAVLYNDKNKEDYLKTLFDKETKLDTYRRLFFPKDPEIKDAKDAKTPLDKGFANLQYLDKEKPYVAFVAADGDNFGANNAKISAFLPAFNKLLPKLVQDFGGQVIYQGGDDISFYVPLTNRYRNQDVFTLIRKIDKLFKQEVLDKVTDHAWVEGNVPSLSYGVVFSYNKHPMNETRKRALYLLEKEAKKQKRKNSICWELRKHSGQTSGGKIQKKNQQLMDNTIALIQNALKGKKSKNDDKNFLHSVTHGIMSYKPLLENILAKEDKKVLLNNFFHNVYGDNYKQYATQLDLAQNILNNNCFKANALNATDYPGNAIAFLHNILRYIELLIGERKETEK